jgi:MFS family permease
MLCFGLGLGTVLVHIVLHAIGLGVSAASAALVLAVVGGLGTVGRVIMGMAGDRIGNKRALTVCFLILVAALFWLLVAKELWMLYLFAAIFGFGYGGIAALASPVVAELFGLSSHGVLLGCMMICTEGGSAIGPVVAGHIFDVTSSYQLAFLICAFAGVAGLMLILLLKSTRREGRSNESGRSA